MPPHRRLVLNSCHGALWGGLGLQGLRRSPGRIGKKRREGFRGKAEAERVGGGATETRYGKVKNKQTRISQGRQLLCTLPRSQKEVYETHVGVSLQQSRNEKPGFAGSPPSQMHSHVRSVNDIYPRFSLNFYSHRSGWLWKLTFSSLVLWGRKCDALKID